MATNAFQSEVSTHSNIAYSNDLEIIGVSINKLNKNSIAWKINSAESGLNIKLSKTKVILIGTHGNSDRVTIGGEAIEVVDQFDYLGRILSKDGSDMPVLEDWIGKTLGAFEMNKGMTSRHISIKTKKRNQMIKKIKVFNKHIMALNVWWKTAWQAIHWKLAHKNQCKRHHSHHQIEEATMFWTSEM